MDSFLNTPNRQSLTIGEQIKSVRLLLGMTQHQLADRMKVNQSFIAEIESGRRKNMELFSLERIAKALECQLLVQAVPKKKISEILREKSAELARKLIALNSGSAALELQAPDQKFLDAEEKALQEELLRKYPSSLWTEI